MSRFLVPLAIAGCMRLDSTGPDGSHYVPDAPPPQSTSLDGPITCGSYQCGTGSICTHWSSGIDGGVPGTWEQCQSVPAQCRVYDCTDDCQQCIYDLCSSAGYGHYVRLEGRNLYCPGV